MGRNIQTNRNDLTEKPLLHRKKDVSSHHKKKETIIKSSVTVKGQLFRTFHWTLSATAAPAMLNLFLNESDTVTYTISATKNSGSVDGFIDGQVSIANLGKAATRNLKITVDLTLLDGTLIARQPVDTSKNPVIERDGLCCYEFHLAIPIPYVSPRAQYKVAVFATITNFAKHAGSPYGPCTTREVTMPVSEVLTCDTINIDTSDGISFTFYDTNSQSYTQKVTCQKEGEQLLVSSATIRETNQTTSATVTIKGFPLFITQTRQKTSFDRTYNWTITETAVDMLDRITPVSSLVLSINQSFHVYCKILVTPSFADSHFNYSSLIIVTNPAPKPARITAIDILLSDNWIVPVVFSPTLLSANSQIAVPCTISLPDQISRTCRVAVLLQHASESATTQFLSPYVPIEFNSSTEINSLDEYVTVSNSSQGLLGLVHKDAREFCYARQIGPFNTSLETAIESISTLQTSDTASTDSTTCLIKVKSCIGYTHTMHYWQAHCGLGPQADLVTPLLPIALGEIQGPVSITIPANGNQQVLTLLQYKGSDGIQDAANGINQIYAQLLTAKLNIGSGTDNKVIACTIIDAEEFLTAHDSSGWAELVPEEKERILALASTLEKFNNGLIGPGGYSEEKGLCLQKDLN